MKEINNLIEEIRLRREKILVSPAELKVRQEIWGNEEISLVATVDHYNLSRPSRGLVGWWRFKVLLETLNLRGLWIIIDNSETIRNEKQRCGGGDGLDFGPFGFFKSKEEVQTEILEKKVSNFFQGLEEFPKLPKPLRRLFVQSLTGRIKGVAEHLSGLSGFLMPGDSRIRVVRLSELLNRNSSTFSFFKEKRWEWVRKSGVIHFGNTYYIDAVKEPHFLPDGCNSQPIGVWELGRKELDVSTLHLLSFGAKEYRSLLQKRAKNFLLEVPRFQWEYLLEKWG